MDELTILAAEMKITAKARPFKVADTPEECLASMKDATKRAMYERFHSLDGIEYKLIFTLDALSEEKSAWHLSVAREGQAADHKTLEIFANAFFDSTDIGDFFSSAKVKVLPNFLPNVTQLICICEERVDGL